MNAITPTTATRLTLLADLGDNMAAEFMANQITISTGAKGGTSILTRPAWAEIIKYSATFDAIMVGEQPPVLDRPQTVSLPSATPTLIYPELGAEIGGGFCGGRHPEIDGAVLVTAGGDGEATDKSWAQAGEHCAAYRAGGHDDWRRFTRLEKLTLWLRLGAPRTQVEAFKKGGKHAFAEEAYWTGDEYEFGSGYAWGQHFGYGDSGDWGKRHGLRVRPGRIHFIQP